MERKVIILLVNVLLITKSVSKKSNVVKNDYFPVSLEALYETETQVIKDLQQYVKKESKRLEFLETYYNRLKTEYEIAIKDVSHYLGNPINSFTLIKRLGPDLEQMHNVLKEKTAFKKKPGLTYPTDDDIRDCVMSLSLLQDSYDLNVTQLSNGKLEGSFRGGNEKFSEKVHPLSTRDLYMIGRTLIDSYQHKKALPWLMVSYRKYVEEGCEECNFKLADVAETISGAYYSLRDLSKAVEWSQIRLDLDPEKKNNAHFIDVLENLKNEQMVPPLMMPSPTAKAKDPNEKTELEIAEEYFAHLCRGSLRSPPNKTKSFSCYYTSGPDKFFLLARLRTEVVHRSPQVLMFHGVLNDQEIEELKNIAQPMFKNTKSQETTHLKLFVTNLEDSIDVVSGVSQKVSRITGLSVDSSEQLKVVKYTPGRIYPLHEDMPNPPPKSKRGKKNPAHKTIEKLGSFMFFLSDVQLGGATVFPALNVTVFPEKGAALFWMNYLPNGIRDRSMMYMICATLRGTNWVATKWPSAYKEKRCPTWLTEQGPVTRKNYIEALKEHDKLWKKIMFQNTRIDLQKIWKLQKI